jgi:hypothetical protein
LGPLRQTTGGAATDGGSLADLTQTLMKSAPVGLGDEVFVAAVKCVAKGHIRRSAFGGGFGAIGAAVTGSLKAPDGHAVDGQKLPKVLYLGLTPTRLFLIGQASLTGKPADVKAVVALSDISGVNAGKGRTVGIKQVDIEIAFVDGGTLAVEVPRIYFAAGERFAEALRGATVGETEQ